MSQNDLLSSCQWNLLWASIALTSGILFTSQPEPVSAKSISDKLPDRDSVIFTIPPQKLPKKILRPQTLTQVPNPIPPRKIELPELPIPDSQSEPNIPLELKKPEIPPLPETPQIPRTITVKKFEFTGNSATVSANS